MATYSPNHIPFSIRVTYIVLSAILLAYGTFGIYVDDVYIPGSRSRGIHLHGEPAWIMYGAMLCAALNLLSMVLDHYDKRDNEVKYKLFAHLTQGTGWILFGGAYFMGYTGFGRGA